MNSTILVQLKYWSWQVLEHYDINSLNIGHGKFWNIMISTIRAPQLPLNPIKTFCSTFYPTFDSQYYFLPQKQWILGMFGSILKLFFHAQDNILYKKNTFKLAIHNLD